MKRLGVYDVYGLILCASLILWGMIATVPSYVAPAVPKLDLRWEIVRIDGETLVKYLQEFGSPTVEIWVRIDGELKKVYEYEGNLLCD